MNPFGLETKLIIGAVIVAALVGSGIWFRGVLADNTEMKTKIAAQKEEIDNMTAEVDRMTKQDAVDHALFAQVEERKAALSAELNLKLRELRKAKEALDEATRGCFGIVLPDSYLERLPQAPDPVRP